MKKHKITIAEALGGQPVHLIPVVFDLDVLRTSHLLITGVSGSGKSYATRVLIENTATILPIFVIDPEGEYASLREKFNFVLVGEGGDIPIHPSTAATTARRLMKLNVSAIFDLSSLPVLQQHLWVKNFFAELMALPRSEWHPLLIVLDEAHVFCPEEGDSEAHDVMLDVAKRGRKRGWMNAWATQRLSSLDKDAAAELQNTMIGRTALHNDRERAAKILGVLALKGERDKFFAALKVLQQGQFYFQGVAVSADMVLGKIMTAQTRHPEPGSHKEITFPTPAQIKALLPELSKITEDAVEQEKKKLSLEEENKGLREQIASLQSQPTGPDPVEVEQIKETEAARWRDVLDKNNEHWRGIVAQFKTWADGLNNTLGRLTLAANETHIARDEIINTFQPLGEILKNPEPPRMFFLNEQQELPRPVKVPGVHEDAPPIRVTRREPGADGRGPGRAERRILRVLSLNSSGCPREMLAVRTVYAPGGGGFKKALSNLKSWGMIQEGDPVKITDVGRNAPHDLVPKPGLDLINEWMATLGKAEKALLKAVTEAPAGISKDQAAAKAGYDPNGGGFKKALSTVRTLGLITGKDTLRMSVHLR